jgi:hypothetical protein
LNLLVRHDDFTVVRLAGHRRTRRPERDQHQAVDRHRQGDPLRPLTTELVVEKVAAALSPCEQGGLRAEPDEVRHQFSDFVPPGLRNARTQSVRHAFGGEPGEQLEVRNGSRSDRLTERGVARNGILLGVVLQMERRVQFRERCHVN